MKKNILITLFLLFLPMPVLADVISTQSIVFFSAPYLLPLIIVAETLALWLIAKYIKKKSIGLARCLLAIAIANIISALIGMFIPLGKGTGMVYTLLIIGYPLSAIIEAPFIKLLIHSKVYSTKEIFGVSFLVNLVSYVPIAIWLLIA